MPPKPQRAAFHKAASQRRTPVVASHAPARSVEIIKLGARGDGVAKVDGVDWYIPFALPGELMRAQPAAPRGEGLAAKILEIERTSPDRIAPACRHFGACGGCDLQHLAPAPYRAFKRDRVFAALKRRGFEPGEIALPEAAPAAARRRLALAALRTADGVVLGLHQQGTHRIEKLLECPIADPSLVRLFAPAAAFLAIWLRQAAKADLIATVTEAGLDLLIEGPAPSDAARVAAGDFMAEAGVARLSWRAGPAAPSETVLTLADPTILLSGRVTPLPPGSFLQATAAGEAAIVAAVRKAIGKPPPKSSGRLADLFCGCGTLSLPLAQDGWKVTGVERDPVAISALLKASRGPGPTLPVEGFARDLDDRPLAEDELKGFAGVVFDPPRAGAKAQASALARSNVPLVAAISCNPETFARDARILVDGGYLMGEITVIDQFLWSHHVELVAGFRRG